MTPIRKQANVQRGKKRQAQQNNAGVHHIAPEMKDGFTLCL
jgi:hypothetical protein